MCSNLTRKKDVGLKFGQKSDICEIKRPNKTFLIKNDFLPPLKMTKIRDGLNQNCVFFAMKY
jgi:hypothetical protein